MSSTLQCEGGGRSPHPERLVGGHGNKSFVWECLPVLAHVAPGIVPEAGAENGFGDSHTEIHTHRSLKYMTCSATCAHPTSLGIYRDDISDR